MTRRYEAVATLTVAGDVRDVSIRAHVEVAYDVGPNGFGARIDGEIEVRLGRSWVPAEEAELGEGDMARATEALEEMALNDDRDQCVESDDDDRFARDCAE